MVKVNDFSFGSIVVNYKKYSRDVFIFADGTVKRRKGGIWMFGSHNIQKKELEELLKGNPEVIIIGTGTDNKACLSSEAESWAKVEKLDFTVMPSHEAVTRLNELAGKGKKASALIHITC